MCHQLNDLSDDLLSYILSYCSLLPYEESSLCKIYENDLTRRLLCRLTHIIMHNISNAFFFFLRRFLLGLTTPFCILFQNSKTIKPDCCITIGK